MANPEQLALLKRDIQDWNHWRKAHPQTPIDLRNAHLPDADLSEADLHDADLSDADLRYANLQNALLRNANLSQTILRGSNLSDASCRHLDLRRAYLSYASLQHCDLRGADLSETDLSDADLSNSHLSHAILLNADLRRAYLSDANLHAANLYNSDLSYATLRFTDFYQADLRKSSLSYADLRSANLCQTRVLNTQFCHAMMTGACIEGWHIGRRTNLDKVQCRYIFRKFDPSRRIYLQRQPEDPKSTFAPGEFAFRFQVLQNVLSVLDLHFTEGIDWQAFLQAFQELRQERSDEIINLRGIERKGETFVVRLEVDAEAEKTAIEAKLQEIYKTQLKRREDSFRESQSYEPQDLMHFRQRQASIPDIIQTIANVDWLGKNGHTNSHSSFINRQLPSDLQHPDPYSSDL
jgi:uncharacterized protein YjbI with pentapeptide repeats